MNKLHALFEEISQKLEPVFSNKTLRNQTIWWILHALTEKQESSLIAQEDKFELTPAQQQKLDQWLKDLIIEKKPLQYVLGYVPFGDLTISVEAPILIPRPETEEWVLALAQTLKKLQDQNITILDIGAGTGCIALSLAKALPNATVYAIDIDIQAIALAKRNAQQNNIKNVHFLESDVFIKIPKNVHYDIIVSNPPYIEQEEWEKLDTSVKDWESPSALMAPEHGLYFIKKIINEAPARIKLNKEMAEHAIPQLALEIGYNQGPQAKLLMEHAGYNAIHVQQDMFGNDRVISGRVDHVADAPCT